MTFLSYISFRLIILNIQTPYDRVKKKVICGFFLKTKAKQRALVLEVNIED